MTNNPNSITAMESSTNSSKSNRFVESTKRAVRKVLTTAGITVGSMGPVATPTVVPASVNTITAIAPIASTTIKTIGLGTAAGLLAACSGGEDGPDGPIDTKDTVAPTINISQSEIDISGGKQVRIDGNQLYIGDVLVASWSDNVSKNCNVTLSLNGKSIAKGTTISEEGTLTIKVSDAAGNSKTAEVKLNTAKNAPSIKVNQYEINILGGTKVSVNNNQLLLGDDIIASRDDENLESCKVTLSFNGKEISSGSTINEAGKLTLTVTNKSGKSSTAEITVTNEGIYGLENLRNASLQVDKKIDLLNGITFADGIELIKTEIEIDGQTTTISDPKNYTPEYPGTCNIIFTIKGKSGNTIKVNVDNLNIKPLEYVAMEVNNIQPKEILPIVGQVEEGDKKVYNHIEHLRLAESTRIRDMMRKYGAGNHSPEEYQQLMNRLNTGMLLETPKGYSNYEVIGGDGATTPSNHSHNERDILNTLIEHANFKVVDPTVGDRDKYVKDVISQNPYNIYIFGMSSYTTIDSKDIYDRSGYNDQVKELGRSKNFLLFIAGSNIGSKNGVLKNKIYHESVNGDEHGIYGVPSGANGKNDSNVDRHLLVTIGTDADGDIDQTNEKSESSKYPVGFHNKVLFSGRAFPYRSGSNNKVTGEPGKYATSFTNYTNVAIIDLCFQMFAEVENVDKLLEMARSTALTDYIRFNGETQELQLMNPAGFFEKYLMPNNLPSNLKSGENVSLNKGYYKGVIFDIPGAEVKINGQWVTYSEANKSQIKNQNPMNLEWRLNGDLCRKMGYKGKDIQGKIIVVDDKWNGLNIEKDISINIK